MMNTNAVKHYFRSEGTVSKWWNPTEGPYAYLFEQQLNIIGSWLRNLEVNDCLEVSCGKGRAAQKLSKLCGNYLATDISEEMVRIAKSSYNRTDYSIQDAENLGIKSSSKDCVICLESLVHFPNPKKAIGEFYRVLKNGGFLIIDSDNKNSLRRLVKRGYQIIEQNHHPFGKDIFTSYAKSQLIEMVTAAGFSIERFKYLGTISPISIHTVNNQTFTLLSQKTCEKLQKLNIDKVPIINRLGTYHLILAKK